MGLTLNSELIRLLETEDWNTLSNKSRSPLQDLVDYLLPLLIFNAFTVKSY